MSNMARNRKKNTPSTVYFPADFTGNEKYSLKSVFPDDKVFINKDTLMRKLRKYKKRCVRVLVEDIKYVKNNKMFQFEVEQQEGVVAAVNDILWYLKQYK